MEIQSICFYSSMSYTFTVDALKYVVMLKWTKNMFSVLGDNKSINQKVL